MTAPQPAVDELDRAVRRLIAESLRPPPPAPRLRDRPLAELIEERRRAREVLDAEDAEQERLLGNWRLREVTAEVADWELQHRATAPPPEDDTTGSTT